MSAVALPPVLKPSIDNILPDQIWMVVVGFVVAFGLAFSIGANDVANSFGTSVGSKVLTIKQASALATVCEILGAVLLGAKVSNTIRKGIVDVELYNSNSTANGATLLMSGQVAALGGASIWLLIATLLSLPVSGSHSIVGSTMGFGLVNFGLKAVNWWAFGKIVASWFISPLLSGVTSVGVFFLMKVLVLRKEERLEPALRMLPGFYGVVVLVNSISIFYDGPTAFHFDKIPVYGVAILSCGLGCITAVLVKFLVLPRIRKRILYNTESEVPRWRRRLMHSLSRLFHCLRFGNKRKSGDTGNIQEMVLKESAGPEVNGLSRDDVGQLEDGICVYQIEGNGSLNPEAQAMQLHQTGPAKINVPDTQNYTGPVPNGKGSGSLVSPVPQQADRSTTARVFEVKPFSTSNDDNKGHRPNSLNTETAGTSPLAVGFSGKATNVLPQPHLPTIGEEEVDVRVVKKNMPSEERVFSSLQVITAVFGSFAHGGNDVSNAIGPLIGLWIIALTQNPDSKEMTPVWLLLYGGVGISVGLWVLGRRVIRTLGEGLTDITPSNGVCIEIGSALTVLIASKIGLPISTTHCKVGSVVLVGRARSKDSVQWSLFLKIIGAWLLTVPVSCGFSALLMYIFTLLI